MIRVQQGAVQMTACNELNSGPSHEYNAVCCRKSSFPEQIWELDSETGRQLRTAAYGKLELARPVPDYTRLAPNTCVFSAY
jgi:hypothetical protein